ncbi:MAG: hypothetical protein GXO66_07540 [Euryarchaeota archaeon]|nr:hypothetical protein [Euryarchaeota archaeon]
MPYIALQLSDEDLEHAKLVLGEACESCELSVEGRREKGIVLRDRAPKNLYALLAIYMQSRVDWRR